MALADRHVTAVLLDIEGTTTPIAFVHDVLFPFARARLESFLHQHREKDEIRAIVDRFAVEHRDDVARGEHPPALANGLVAYVSWLMDRDRKSPALKELQGLIWRDGYETGALHGQIFPDVAPALRRWHDAGITVAIYSSGSELAQRLLFASTDDGDLTPLIAAFFDTAVGPKRAADSYRSIARALGRQPREILFVSDVIEELAAARAAGMYTVLSIRPGNAPQPGADRLESVMSFEEL